MKYSKLLPLITMLLLLATATVTYSQDTTDMFTVGWLSFFPIDEFKDEMATLGYIEGENITYIVPSYENVAPEQFFDQYMIQVQAMVDLPVDVLVTNTDTDAVNTKPIAGDIPIVFARSDDPVATGAVASLVAPGSSMTGVVTNRPHERRLQILTEIDPTTRKIYYLYNTASLEGEAVLEQVQLVGEAIGVEVIPMSIADGPSGAEILAATPDDIDWLFLTPYVPFDPVFFEALATASQTHRIGISWATNDPFPNYLMGYGPDISETDRQAAQLVDLILRGANPAEVPVQTAENYLMVNLEAAEAIGLEIPESVLRQANIIVRPGFFDVTPPPAGS